MPARFRPQHLVDLRRELVLAVGLGDARQVDRRSRGQLNIAGGEQDGKLRPDLPHCLGQLRAAKLSFKNGLTGALLLSDYAGL